MSAHVYLPPDEFGGQGTPNLDLAADFLELRAWLSESGQSLSGEIIGALQLSAEAEYADVNSELSDREDVAAGALVRLKSRQRVLEASYPFDLGPDGDAVFFVGDDPNLGQTAYLVSLLLSNLSALSPLLDGSALHPCETDVRRLREYFQYFATAAIAAEIGGPAWSFGFPRPDGSGFVDKLTEIWAVLKDGRVKPHSSASSSPKDDQVDVFAWRKQRDGLPGFLLVAAQVATGRDWRSKSIRCHIDRPFPFRWFEPPPATVMIAYHVIPFARADAEFRDDVIRLGNVLHRLRVPRRVLEAADLVQNGVTIEAFDRVEAARDWIGRYMRRARAA